jgi:hypothetical protein
MAVAMLVVVGSVVVPIARAIARRIAGPTDPQVVGDVRALRDEVEQLRAELDALQGRFGQVDEMQERLDFAERLLAQARVKGALPGAPS